MIFARTSSKVVRCQNVQEFCDARDKAAHRKLHA